MINARSHLLALIVVAACAALADDAQASVSLVLSPVALPGYRSVAVSRRTARADLGPSLARDAAVQARGASGAGRQLRSEAFTFSATAAALKAASLWKRSAHGRAVRIGKSSGATAVRRSGKRFVVTVVWREQQKVGLLRLVGAGRSATSTKALQFARAADSALRSPLPSTAWDKVLDQIRPDGSVSQATALQAFAVAYSTKLPGVTTPTGSRGAIDDATPAATMILRFRDKVTPAQRAIIDHALGLSEPGTTARAAVLGDPLFVEDPELTTLAQSFVPAYEPLLEHKLALPIVAGVTTVLLKGPNGIVAYADALSVDQAGASGPVCRIRTGSPRPPIGDPFLNLAMAHEVFHCFHQDIAPLTPADLWVQEGLATWASLTVHPAPYASHLRTYINTSRKRLFERSYDAVGFWGHVQDVTGNLWVRIPAILKAQGGVASYQAAVGTADFTGSWGSSVFRSIAGDINWGMASPPIAIPGLAALPPAQMTDISSSQPVYAEPWTTAQYRLKADADNPLINVAIDGPARLSDSKNYTQLKDQFFCTSPSGCDCPTGKTGSVPTNQPLDPDALLGLGAAGGATTGIVVYHSLDEFCDSDKRGINGTWDGTYQSSKYPRVNGTFTVTFAQKGGTLDGVVHIRNSDCVTGGPVTGRIAGDRITFGVVVAQKTINYSGTVSGNHMSGSFVAAGCGNDRGTWSAVR